MFKFTLKKFNKRPIVKGFYGFGLILFMVLFSSCAEPKYVKSSGTDAGTFSITDGEEFRCDIQFKNSEYCLAWAWILQPTEKDMGELVFKIYRKNLWDDSVVLEDVSDHIDLILWMPSMAHGSVPTRIERQDVGTYIARQVFFIMPGDWELRFQIKEEQKVIDEALVALFI